MHGSARLTTLPGQHMTQAEKVLCNTHYCLLQNPDRKCRMNAVKEYAFKWGVSTSFLHSLLADAKTNTTALRRSKIKRDTKYMDMPEVDEIFMNVLTYRTRSKVSIETPTARFNEKTTGRAVNASMVRRKLKDIRARKVKRVYVQQLSPSNEAARFQMASENIKNRWVHHYDLDEKWFFVVTCDQWVWVCDDRMTPEEIMAIKNVPVRSKRFITKVMFLTVVGRPCKIINSDGKVYIRRCSQPYKAKKKSKYHERGDWYEKDCTVTGKYFIALCSEICAAITDLYASWDEDVYGPKPVVTVQIDGAGPHRAEATEAALKKMGRACSPQVVWWRQAAQCPQVKRHAFIRWRFLAPNTAQAFAFLLFSFPAEMCMCLYGCLCSAT